MAPERDDIEERDGNTLCCRITVGEQTCRCVDAELHSHVRVCTVVAALLITSLSVTTKKTENIHFHFRFLKQKIKRARNYVRKNLHRKPNQKGKKTGYILSGQKQP